MQVIKTANFFSTINIDLLQQFSRREMTKSCFGCSVNYAMDAVEYVNMHRLGFGNISYK